MSKLASILKNIPSEDVVKKQRERLTGDLRSFLTSSQYGDVMHACTITRSCIILAMRNEAITLLICGTGLVGRERNAHSWQVELRTPSSLFEASARLIPSVDEIARGFTSNYHGGAFASNVERLLQEGGIVAKLESSILGVRRTLGLDAPKLQE